jgi:hypothetical protein bfra3_11661
MKLKRQYFKHDYGARNDPKLLSVQARFGLAGIGFYWCLVELLYENCGEVTTQDVSNLAFVMRFDDDDAQKLIKCFDLFEVDGDRLFSQSMKHRIEQTTKTSESRRNASNARWANNRPEKPKTPENVPENANPGTNTGKSVSEKPNIVQIKYETIKNAWNRICVSLPKVVKLTESRKEKIRIRIGQMKPDVCQAYGVNDPYQLFEKIFGIIEQSDFCKGINNNGWTADFNWITERKDAWENVLNGRYNNKPKPQTRSQENNINVNDLWK